MRKLLIFGIIGILGSLLLVTLFSYMILDFLWLWEQDFIHTAMRIFAFRWLMIPSFSLLFGIFFYIYLQFFSPPSQRKQSIILLKTAIIIIVTFVFETLSGSGQNLIYSLFAGSTGIKDSLINQDFSFYLFAVPLIRNFSFLACIIFSGLGIAHSFSKGMGKISWTIALGFMFVSLIILRLDFMIQSSSSYLGYLDFFAHFIPFIVSLIIVLIFLLLILWIFSINSKVFLYGGSGVALLVLILNFVVPRYLENFVYNPNKSTYQIRFAGVYADSTRKSFGLDVMERNDSYLVSESNVQDVLSNTFWNDSENFVQAIRNNQEILPIFQINNASILTINSNGKTIPAFISAREIEENPSDDWDIKHFRNIFGFGAVIGSASEFDDQGFPLLFLKNLTPQSLISNISLKQAEIFFAENYDNYAFINTSMLVPLFETDNNQLESQQFSGIKSIPINWFTKILLAIVHKDYRFILTDYFTPETRFLMNRKPSEIVKKILPMFHYDEPQLIYQDQELWWMLEGYSVSDAMFLSKKVDTPWGKYNWVRSPIKAYVSAYSGETRFEVIDHFDPHVKIAHRLFPKLFEKKMILETEKQVYPKRLFDIQSKLITQFHEEDEAVFYSGLNELEISKSEDKIENIKHIFLTDKKIIASQRTYSPLGKNIFRSRLMGMMDKNKKRLIYYEASSDKGIPGLSQAESFLNQDQDFSRLATLWDQRGSKLLKSGAIFYPTKEGGFYAQTIFLESENIKIPLSTRQVIINGSAVLLANNLDTIIGESETMLSKVFKPNELTSLQKMRNIILEAYQYFLNAQNERIQGNTQEYSKNVDKIGETLQKADI